MNVLYLWCNEKKNSGKEQNKGEAKFVEKK